MSIVSSIESHLEALRAKVGTLSAELEQHIANFLGMAKAEEAAAEAKVQVEIDHLKALGYQVTTPAEQPLASPTEPTAPTAA